MENEVQMFYSANRGIFIAWARFVSPSVNAVPVPPPPPTFIPLAKMVSAGFSISKITVPLKDIIIMSTVLHLGKFVVLLAQRFWRINRKCKSLQTEGQTTGDQKSSLELSAQHNVKIKMTLINCINTIQNNY
jgi:hypothetical protein